MTAGLLRWHRLRDGYYTATDYAVLDRRFTVERAGRGWQLTIIALSVTRRPYVMWYTGGVVATINTASRRAAQDLAERYRQLRAAGDEVDALAALPA